ncbi:MAG: hypothetical protein V9F82_04775 [Dermatophilaceae bacterium]
MTARPGGVSARPGGVSARPGGVSARRPAALLVAHGAPALVRRPMTPSTGTPVDAARPTTPEAIS